MRISAWLTTIETMRRIDTIVKDIEIVTINMESERIDLETIEIVKINILMRKIVVVGVGAMVKTDIENVKTGIQTEARNIERTSEKIDRESVRIEIESVKIDIEMLKRMLGIGGETMIVRKTPGERIDKKREDVKCRKTLVLLPRHHHQIMMRVLCDWLNRKRDDRIQKPLLIHGRNLLNAKREKNQRNPRDTKVETGITQNQTVLMKKKKEEE